MECKDGVSDDELTKLLKISQETKVDILNKML
jgi:hypothetical protein